MIELQEIVEFLDDLLRIREIPDYPGARNGLQVENRSSIERVAAAVDACQATIGMAAEAGVQLLLVHHGLFWGDPLPIAGITYRRLRALFDADLALYAAHLPLDLHPEVGNSVLLARRIGIEIEGRFGSVEGVDGIGVWATADLSREEVVARVARACDVSPFLIAAGPSHIRRVGVVTGGGGSLIRQAWEEGLDTFITGEGTHHSYHEAAELGLNVLYAGHYATETFGVRALAERVASRFGLESRFLDHPTGL